MDHLDFAAAVGRRLAVLGDPIKHSLSPAMHNAALAYMAADYPEMVDWCYHAIHVPASDLKLALQRLHEAGVTGINLTIPHKVIVLEFLQGIDDTAVRMGAVNTLKWTESGYYGSNTDGYGIQKGIAESLGRELTGADVWLFGAGGAARGILIACLDAGARRVTVINRSKERLAEFTGNLLRLDPGDKTELRFFASVDNPGDPGTQAILINATSLGLKAEDPSPVPESFLLPGICVYDTTYGAANQLARDCRARGLAYADGLPMLVWQGVRSLEIWTGKPVSAEHMRKAAESELKRRAHNG